MNETPVDETPSTFTSMAMRDFIWVLLLGAGAGLLVWGLSYLLDVYVFQAIFCKGDVTVQCSAAPQYGAATASIVTAILMLLGLVRLGVYRPLLVVLAVTISLWGLTEFLLDATWYVSALWTILLYALAYAVFTWISRVRMFWLAVIISFGLLLVMRFLMTS
ncbi:MAG TPA: hypothetical protein VK497_00925 [Candidatus Saccharimonadales bacterium]|nr:hypothetical protein [Candidatus Saccharimonadales bacterium]